MPTAPDLPQDLVADLFERHGAVWTPGTAERGTGGTYPCILSSDAVLKLMPGTPRAQRSWSNEMAALNCLAAGPALPVPALLGSGQIEAAGGDHLYILMSRVKGEDWRRAEPAGSVRLPLARALGEALRQIHALSPVGVAALVRPGDEAVISACGRSSLPRHLMDDIPDFLAAHPARAESALVHGDLMDLHMFHRDGSLTGIIDWGDAVSGDRTYEFGKLHLDLFEVDKEAFAVFLQAYGARMDEEFSALCLANALIRQTHCCAQHGGCDVFHKLPGRVDMDGVESLEALARLLFGV